MSSIRRRLRKLEQGSGPCPACRGRPGVALVIGREEGGRLERRREDPHGACPACGREPLLVRVVETAVRTRDEAHAFLEQA